MGFHFNLSKVPVAPALVPLAQYPNLIGCYNFGATATSATLQIEFKFAVTTYFKNGTIQTGLIKNHVITYGFLYEQLSGIGSKEGEGIFVGSSFNDNQLLQLHTTEILTYIAQIYYYLLEMERGNLEAPIPGNDNDGKLFMEVPITFINRMGTFELLVYISIFCCKTLAEKGKSTMINAVTYLNPETTTPKTRAKSKRSLLAFINRFETLFSDPDNKKLLKISVEQTKGRQKIWVVSS